MNRGLSTLIAVFVAATTVGAQDPGSPEKPPPENPKNPENGDGARGQGTLPPGPGRKAAPGIVDRDVVQLEPLVVPAREGDAKAALNRFLKAHAAHKGKDIDAALRGYFEFLGMPGRHELPKRYVATARARLDDLAAPTRDEFSKAADLYVKDRVAGLAALRELDARVPFLPAGHAARALCQTDKLRAGIDAARKTAATAPAQRNRAANALAEIVKSCPDGLYLYEAKKLILDLGGPDLFEPGERLDRSNRRDPDPTGNRDKKPDKEADDDEPTIEIGDG